MTGRDVVLRGGEVVDGTGAPAVRADVRVRAGRIVEVDPDLRPDGESEFDASGAFVTPGFIDSHAHTDPQVFWDPTLDPEPLHGVTTMLIGNCSLSLHPVNASTRDDIADNFAYVEDVPRPPVRRPRPVDVDRLRRLRDAVNATGAGTNLAALVGHSPLRLAVMGADAWTRVATPDEHAAMAVGALDGFLDEDVDYALRLNRAGGPAELHVYPGACHGFTVLAREALVTKQCSRAMADWLARQLGRESELRL